MADFVSHYRLLDRLGRGGMGSVYAAEDTQTGGTVALKLLHPHLTDDADYIQRFQREARIARSLDSPHIVKVLDAGEEGDSHFLVMEYVQGETLSDMLKREGQLPIERAVGLAAQIAEALVEAHRKGVTHRDLKPQNIIMTSAGEAKVADFGVARMQGQTTMTVTGVLLGTPEYMSPDHIVGVVDIRSDIYSLGIVLYQMLAGVVPFKADTVWTVLQMQNTAPPPPLNSVRRDVPEWLDFLVQHCLEKKPEDRFQTPLELQAALEGEWRKEPAVVGIETEETLPLSAAPTVRRLAPSPDPTLLINRRSVVDEERVARPRISRNASVFGVVGLVAVLALVGIVFLSNRPSDGTASESVSREPSAVVVSTSVTVPAGGAAPTATPTVLPSAPVATAVSGPTVRRLVSASGQSAVPDLAQSWEMSASGETMTLRLASNVRMPDGNEFEASVAKRILDQNRSTMTGYQSSEVLDPRTLRIVWSSGIGTPALELSKVTMFTVAR